MAGRSNSITRWSEQLSACFSRGVRDFKDGLEYYDCPYIGGGVNLQRMREWMKGYSVAEKAHEEKQKSNRGGKRAGAGRKPVSGVTRISRSIDLTPLVWEFLTSGGNTAASEIETRIRDSKAFKDWKRQQGK